MATAQAKIYTDSVPTVLDDTYASGSIVERSTGAVLLGFRRDGGVEIPGFIPPDASIAVLGPEFGESVALASGVVDRATGGLIYGYTSDGRFITPERELADWQRNGAAVMLDPNAATTGLIIGTGQSNGTGAMSFGQPQRTPWEKTQDYPPNFAGEADAPDYITTSMAQRSIRTPYGVGPTGSAETGALPDLLRTVFNANGTGRPIWGTVEGESQYRAMATRLLAQYPQTEWAIMAGNAEGGRSLSFLRRPTNAEIAAGTMTTSQGPVAIPQASAEYRSLAAGRTFADLWKYRDDECASRFYKGARMVAVTANELRKEGRRCFGAFVNISHGEDHSDGAAYQTLFRQHLVDMIDMTKQITFQTEDPICIITTPGNSDYLEAVGSAGFDAWKASGYLTSYEPGGANSRYRPDADRVSGSWDTIIAMQNVARSMPGVYMGYNRAWRDNHIHSEPFVMRENGEVTAEIYADAVFRKAGRKKGMWATDVRISGDSAILTIETPLDEDIEFKVPTGTGVMTTKPGYAYGFQYERPNGSGGWTLIPLAEADVTILDRRHIRIKPAGGPQIGDRVSGNVGSRALSVVTKNPPAALYNFRDGQPNKLTSRLLPFQLIAS